MDKIKRESFKAILLQHKSRILNSSSLSNTEDFAIPSDDLADETDLASNVIHQQVAFRLRDSEIQKLKAIDEALLRIEQDVYGICDECGEEISEKRLLNFPWATLCVTHAEELEREMSRVKIAI